MKKKPSELFENYETSIYKQMIASDIPVKPIKKMTKKELTLTLDWANSEVAEWDAFAQLIKEELKKRK